MKVGEGNVLMLRVASEETENAYYTHTQNRHTHNSPHTLSKYIQHGHVERMFHYQYQGDTKFSINGTRNHHRAGFSLTVTLPLSHSPVRWVIRT